jgi:hypothetical protein
VRGLVRAAIVAALVLAGALAGLSLWLPRWIESAGVQQRLREAIREATGREPSWTKLEVGVLPPRLRIDQARLGDGSDLSVAHAELRFALLPLLARTLVVDHVSIDGELLRVVRTEHGFVWPWLPPAADGEAAPPAPPKPSAAPPGAPAPSPPAAPAVPASAPARGFSLAVRNVDLSHARMVVEDRTVRPPVRVEIDDLGGHAHASARHAPLDARLEGRLASGGTVHVDGRVVADGELDLILTLDGVDLTPLEAWAGKGVHLGGAAHGTLHLTGPTRAPTRLDVDVSLDDARFQVAEAEIDGPVSVQARLRGDLARPVGTFSIDATRAEVVYGGAFRKEPGAPATAEGRLAVDPAGRLRADDVHVRIRNLGGQARLEAGGGHPLAFELDAPPFDAADLGALVPALAPLVPDGRLALDHLSVGTAPLTVRGRVLLDGLRLHPGGRGPTRSSGQGGIVLRGALVGEGGSVRSDGLVAEVGGQRLDTQVTLADLAGSPREQLRVAARGVDAAALLEGLTGRPDLLEGPVGGDVELGGPLGAGVEGLAGTMSFQAGPGRIPSFSPLALALERLRDLGGPLADLERGRRGQALQRFTGDAFESLSGHVRLADGNAHSDDLTLRYPGYAIEVAATVRLADQNLDGQGRLVLGPDLYAALVDRPPGSTGGGRVLPISHLGGTLGHPAVKLDPQASLALAAQVAAGGKRRRIEHKLDKVLGDGAGRDVLDALDGLLSPAPAQR